MSIRATLAADSRAAALRARTYAHEALRGHDMGEFRHWIRQAIERWQSYQSLRVRAA